MQSHSDRPDHGLSDDLLERLRGKADEMNEARANVITAGEDDENPIRSWQHGTMKVEQRPDDEQGVLRISIGGNVGFGYCVFRGSRAACRTLLAQALTALAP